MMTPAPQGVALLLPGKFHVRLRKLGRPEERLAVNKALGLLANFFTAVA
jgi:hypothetical protein